MHYNRKRILNETVQSKLYQISTPFHLAGEDASARSGATEQRSLRIAPIASHATARHSPRCVENRKRKPPAFVADGFGRGDASARSGATEQRSLRIAPIASHATARHSPRCVENRKRKPPAFIADGFGRGDAIRTRNLRFWRPLLYR